MPVESSRRYLPFGGPAELLELDGAQHGFAVHDDPQYSNPQTKAWQAEVIERVTGFLTVGCVGEMRERASTSIGSGSSL